MHHDGGEELDAAKLPYGVGVANVSVFGLTKEQMREAFLRSAHAAAKNSCDVPPMLHTETLNDLTAMTETTIFPSPIGLGASFDPAIVGKAAQIIHRQTRTMGYYQALVPVLDVYRDPRWGRVGETYGEDPTLNGFLVFEHDLAVLVDKAILITIDLNKPIPHELTVRVPACSQNTVRTVFI